jgi:multidrug resistance efflux pump
MTSRSKFVAVAATLVALGGALGGCSGGGGLTTGSLFGSSEAAKVAAAQPVVTSGDRVVQVAAVSARAAKCGFNFDPTGLKTSFMTAEAAQAADQSALDKTEREYDTIRSKVATAISKEPDFCSEAKTRDIKADLTRHLAGDFTPKQVKVADPSLLASAGPKTRETINPEFLTDKQASKTRSVPQ